MTKFIRLVSLFVLLGMYAPVAAHEYYLLPDKFSVAVGEKFAVEHKNGVRFMGTTFPWISIWNIRSEAWQNGVGVKVFGKDGDRPALNLQSNKPGLISIVHESNVSKLTFQKWDKFKSYLAEEGLEWILTEHEAAGYPQEKVKEVYSRFAKTLINVGDADDVETPAGLKIELVALANPASLKRGESLPVKVLYEGKPLSGVAVKVFAGRDTEPAPLIRTGKEGRADIPDSGPGPYLIGAVHMTKPQSKIDLAKDAHWESFWASLTFERK